MTQISYKCQITGQYWCILEAVIGGVPVTVQCHANTPQNARGLALDELNELRGASC